MVDSAIQNEPVITQKAPVTTGSIDGGCQGGDFSLQSLRKSKRHYSNRKDYSYRGKKKELTFETESRGLIEQK